MTCGGTWRTSAATDGTPSTRTSSTRPTGVRGDPPRHVDPLCAPRGAVVLPGLRGDQPGDHLEVPEVRVMSADDYDDYEESKKYCHRCGYADCVCGLDPDS